jgi:hypothetical protein
MGSTCVGIVLEVVGMDGNGAIIRGRFDADEAFIGEMVCAVISAVCPAGFESTLGGAL